MDPIAALKDQVRETRSRIVFPEGNNLKILQAARQLVDERIVSVVLSGNPDQIQQTANQAGIAIGDFELIDSMAINPESDYPARYLARRPNTNPTIAKLLLTKPLYFGAAMVSAGDADLLIAGIEHSTRRVIEAALACIGLSSNTSVPSSFFIMNLVDRPSLLFADCAINVNPTAEELADIAIATGKHAEKLLQEPARIALLSFSSKGSASHPDANKVIAALKIAKNKAPELHIDGELQVDTALIANIAADKLSTPSSVAGAANVLIFPTLDAANIGYKLVQHLANAEAIGPILQGFAKPVADLSRGANVEEIVATAIVALAIG